MTKRVEKTAAHRFTKCITSALATALNLHGKTGNSGWKIKRFAVFWEASKNMGYDLRGCNFLLFLVCSADLDIHCSGLFFPLRQILV